MRNKYIEFVSIVRTRASPLHDPAPRNIGPEKGLAKTGDYPKITFGAANSF
jgi:hypothetical protein